MSYRRRRVPLACTLCRRRKRRCDGRRPSCSTCLELEADCSYDGPVENLHAQTEVVPDKSWERIEALLLNNSQQMTTLIESLQSKSPNRSEDINAQQSPSFPVPSHPFSPSFPSGAFFNIDSGRSQQAQSVIMNVSQADAATPPFTIPEHHSTSSNYLLSTSSVKEMIGHNPSDYFFRLESKNELPPALTQPGAASQVLATDLSVGTTEGLVSSFFAKVHCHHPLLQPSEFAQRYAEAAATGYAPGPSSLLCMTVFALGSWAANDTLETAQTLSGMAYIQRALPELLSTAMWHFSSDTTVLQALVYAAVYLAYLARPLHSWRVINMATTVTHFVLTRLENPKIDDSSRERIIRCFWSCFMIECDRLAELEVPQSELQKLADTMPLPSFGGGYDDAETTYFLAEISIRRLLNRVHNSVYPRLQSVNIEDADIISYDQLNKFRNVCQELHRQLDIWHSSIPGSHNVDLHGTRPLQHPREQFLRMRFFASLHIIYRPFVLHTVGVQRQQIRSEVTEEVMIEDWILENCRICLESCRSYLYNAAEVLQTSSPYTWTFSIS